MASIGFLFTLQNLNRNVQKRNFFFLKQRRRIALKYVAGFCKQLVWEAAKKTLGHIWQACLLKCSKGWYSLIFTYSICFSFLHILKNAAKVATVSNFYIFYPVFTYCYKLLHILKFSKVASLSNVNIFYLRFLLRWSVFSRCLPYLSPRSYSPLTHCPIFR